MLRQQQDAVAAFDLQLGWRFLNRVGHFFLLKNNRCRRRNGGSGCGNDGCGVFLSASRAADPDSGVRRHRHDGDLERTPPGDDERGRLGIFTARGRRAAAVKIRAVFLEHVALEFFAAHAADDGLAAVGGFFDFFDLVDEIADRDQRADLILDIVPDLLAKHRPGELHRRAQLLVVAQPCFLDHADLRGGVVVQQQRVAAIGEARQIHGVRRVAQYLDAEPALVGRLGRYRHLDQIGRVAGGAGGGCGGGAGEFHRVSP